MNRLNRFERVARFALATGSMALVAVAMSAAQSTPTNPPKKPVPAVKPAAAAKAATPVAAVKSAAPNAAAAVKPASSQTVLPTTSTGQTATAPASTQSGPASFLTGQNAPAQQYSSGSQSGDQRSAVTAQGLGTFLWSYMTLTAYGCFRTGTRVFCDYDFTSQYNVQANSANAWLGVNLVDDGGKITGRHNAFFMGQDGSQFSTAYISTNPTRMIMEYDDVSQNFNSVSLVFGNNRIQGVPVTPVDPNQPAGTVPGRGTTQAAGGATGATNMLNGATNAVNNAAGTLNNAQQKAQSVLDSLKNVAPKK